MSRPRFLADHDLNEHIIAGVRRREPTLEFLHARDIGLSEKPDAEILQYAAEQGLLTVSHDGNTMPTAAFHRIADGNTFPGLFMVHQSTPIRTIIENILLVWSASDAEEWANQVIFFADRSKCVIENNTHARENRS
jgi:hypothetical protein